MKRDWPRDAMLPNSTWNAIDVIANYGAPLRQRGGWAHHSEDLSSVKGTAGYVRAGIYAPFVISGSASYKNLAVDEDGELYNCTTAASSTDVGAVRTAAQNPVFHGGTIRNGQSALTGLAIFPDSAGASAPKVYDGTTIATMAGTPPNGKLATVYKDYTVLANGQVSSVLYPNRIWFSPEGDPDCQAGGSWDTTDSWIDFGLPIKGIAANRNAILVFHDGQVSRVRGSIPPPDEDMVVDDPLFTVGLYDPFSLATHKDTILWAAPEGVFRSDGVVLDDLTRRGGMLRYWTDLTSAATSTWTFAGGTHRDTYFLCVMDGTTFKDCFMIDLQSLAWTRLSNVDAIAMWSGLSGFADELYWGRRGGARVSKMSSVFTGVGNSTYKNDGDGDAVTWTVETPFFTFGKPGIKHVQRVWTGHEITDHATDNPTVTVAGVFTPEETSYTTLGTLSENTTYERDPVDVNRRTYGLALKYTGTNAGDRLLYDVTASAQPLEQERRS